MSKRYVLFLADSDLSEDQLRSFGEMIKGRHGGAKVIAVKGNPRAVIIKTTNEVAPLLRGIRPVIGKDKIGIASVLTSGAIGNLKRRASLAAANGKVP